MALSRKHYQAVADVLKEQYELCSEAGDISGASAVRSVAEELAGMFKRDNGAFKYSVFYRAVGIDPPGKHL